MRVLKNISITILSLVIIVSSAGNIKKQTETILETKKINSELEEEIEILKEKNRILERKIELATSSGFMEQQARDMLGMGTNEDYWLVLPPEEKHAQTVSFGKEEITKKNWWQRLREWFTR